MKADGIREKQTALNAFLTERTTSSAIMPETLASLNNNLVREKKGGASGTSVAEVGGDGERKLVQ